MPIIDLPALLAALRTHLTAEEWGQVEARVLGESGLQVHVESDRCLTRIGVWPNGLCDVEFLFAATEEGAFHHRECASADAALAVLMVEIRAALGRARGT